MRYQDDINTEHNMKSICRPAVAQWTERLTRKGQTRVRNIETSIQFLKYCICKFMYCTRKCNKPNET